MSDPFAAPENQELASRDEEWDELSLAPIEDDEAKMVVAPELPFDPSVRWIPVTCSACKTRLYAAESQIGMYKLCPECSRKTEIRPVPEKLVVTVEISENGGYVIKAPEVSGGQLFSLKVDTSHPSSLGRAGAGPLMLDENLPGMEKVLDRLMTDKKTAVLNKARKEKYEESLKFNREIYERSREENANARKLLEAKKAELEKNKGDDWDTYHHREDAKKLPGSADIPPVIPPSAGTESPIAEEIDNEWHEEPRRGLLDRTFFTPFFDERNRPRFVVLLVAGFIAILFSGKTMSMIWQAVMDTVPDAPGHIYGGGEVLQFYIAFIPGTFCLIVWVFLTMLFSVGIFVETTRGIDRIRKWIPFDLEFAFWYLFWTGFFFLLSAGPGYLIHSILGLNMPDLPNYAFYLLLGISQFFLFPVIFLSVAETDTFYKGVPRETLASLFRRPFLWLRFYLSTVSILAIPGLIIYGLIQLNLNYGDSRIMQSIIYYLFSAVVLSAIIGPVTMLYFRLMGRLANLIEIDM